MRRSVNLDFFGSDAELDHIGIAVRSIDNTLGNVQKVNDPIQKVGITLVKMHNAQIELVEPLDENSPVTNVLEKGQTIYHICFKVRDIQLAIEKAREHGFHCIAKPVPAVAFKNKKIAWLFSRTYGLIELLEK